MVILLLIVFIVVVVVVLVVVVVALIIILILIIIIFGNGEKISLLQRVQTEYGAHTVSCSMSVREYFRGNEGWSMKLATLLCLVWG